MVSRGDSRCRVQRGEVDLDHYAAQDGEWREIGLAGPARRALVNAGLIKLQQISKWTRSDVAALHWMGPNALRKLDAALERNEVSYCRSA